MQAVETHNSRNGWGGDCLKKRSVDVNLMQPQVENNGGGGERKGERRISYNHINKGGGTPH